MALTDILVKLNLESILNLNFSEKQSKSLWCFLNNDIALVVDIKMLEDVWKMLVEVGFVLGAGVADVGSHDFFADSVEGFEVKVELSCWAIRSTTFKSIVFDD